jgi:fermentation-respiration switch protein FrsA (DUF1100 family)
MPMNTRTDGDRRRSESQATPQQGPGWRESKTRRQLWGKADRPPMPRREFLAVMASASAALLAGCGAMAKTTKGKEPMAATKNESYETNVPPPPAGAYELGDIRRLDVRFPSDGFSVAAHLYLPLGGDDQPAAGVVLDGPGASVKELTVPVYAIRLARAGYRVLTYDRRGFGASDGRVRQHIDPAEHIADFRNAVTYLASCADVDRERIAGIGVCAGGGYVFQAGAMYRRLRAIAAIAAAYTTMLRPVRDHAGHSGWVAMQKLFAEDRLKDLEAGRVRTWQGIAPSSAPPDAAAIHSDEGWNFYTRRQREVAPNWKNEVTRVSVDTQMTFDAIRFADLITPTPLLIVHGTLDEITPPRYAQQAFDAASEPKQLQWIKTTNHVQLYDQEPYVSQALDVLLPWLARHCPAKQA